MAWLVSEGRVLASAEVAPDRRSRARGLLGRDGVDGAMVIEPCRWVHTVGMRFAIDVAYLDSDGVVVKAVRMRRRRVGLPVFGARRVVEAEAGAFARWGLQVGATVEIRGDQRGAAADTAGAADETTGDAGDGTADGGAVRDVERDPGGTSDAARNAADHGAPRDRRRADGASRHDRDPGDGRRIAVLVASS